ncbi:muscarinic acetylcholine receptor M3-like [Acanthaster planci]|uniref:Muscarinic acetylcholine receptor M3-like n=1 Tax=Acanthaster planci TaxID=133434 RepID=A0A8B8A4G7_ACAPL|nr:muscarinic acetylcholine receptor M3-like [Acanthaster planci]
MDSMGNESAREVNDTDTNISNEYTPSFSLTKTVTLSIVLGIISTMTVIGNIFVIVAYIKDRRISATVANSFILSLSVCDLIVGAVSLPLYSIRIILGYWPFGKIPCQIWLALDYTVVHVAVFTIIFISLDRYWLLTKKLAYATFQTHKRAASMIIASWLINLLFYSTVAFLWGPLAGVDKIDYDNNCELESLDSLPFQAFEIVFKFFIPLLIIVYCNARVYINIKRRSQGIFQKPQQSGELSFGGPSVSTRNHEAISKDATQEQSMDETRLSNVECHYSTKIHVPRTEGGHSNTGFDGKLEDITISLQSYQSQSPAATGLDDNATVTCATDKATVEESLKRPTGRQSNSPDQFHRGTRKEFKRHRKAAVTLSVLVSVFTAMWLPFYMASLLVAICENCFSDLAWIVVNYLLWCNSTINPFLYALLVVQFRQNFIRWLRLIPCTK